MICEESGEVCCAHCNCVAGLGEACTHVGAVLFYLETSTKVNNGVSCTQQKCQWVIPSFQREIPYLPVKELDFTSAKGKQKKIDSAISQHSSSNATEASSTSTSVSLTGNLATVAKPISSEVDDFFLKLSKCNTKPAILSIVDPYSDKYVPKVAQPSFPTPLPQLYDDKYLAYGYIQLLKASEEIDITLTDKMVGSVEMETRDQSKSNLWFTYRAGRITASRMKSVCHTDISNPSQSLIKTIVYPESYKFTSKATSWGCRHEKTARNFYSKKMMENHPMFNVRDSGLTLNPKWPYLGASPDGIVTCECCSKGVVEIKCPFCHRNEDLFNSTDDKHFCLSRDTSGASYLDRAHAYYYQVQTQIFICDVAYCDFVVCTFPEGRNEPDIHIERILPDDHFWFDCVEKSFDFFVTSILPEILGRWYSRPVTHESSQSLSPPPASVPSTSTSALLASLPDPPPSSSTESSDKPVYCYCRQPEDSDRDMIGCDNPGCSIEWYHYTCLKIKTAPKGKWYCPTCRLLPEFKRQRTRGVKRRSDQL